MLHVLSQDPDTDVAGLLTTIEAGSGIVPMQGVDRELVEAQARAAGLPVWFVELPPECPDAEYERRMTAVFDQALSEGFTRVAFGDLYLRDIRAYREAQMKDTGLEPCFPLWGRDTAALAREMIGAGLRSIVVCVDPQKLGPGFLGRCFDAGLLADLPADVDPCGENGEFHSFCSQGPMFSQCIAVAHDGYRDEQGFRLLSLRPA